MTHRASGPASGAPRIWLLPLLALLVLAGLVLAEILSRSLFLDFVAWWPVWAVLALLALVVRGRRAGRVRISGMVPLLATVAIGVLVAAHLLGWPGIPSTSPELVGPAADGVATAALSARVDGELEVRAGGDFLYEVETLRMGGDLGLPDAEEQSTESAIAVELVPPTDPGLYTFSGWEVSLSPGPTWNLTLQGRIDADLTSLRLDGVHAAGAGLLRLGTVSEPTPATVVGQLTIVVGRETAIRIVGEASAPGDWETLSDGLRSPTLGNGWVVSVPSGSAITVVYEETVPG